MQTKKVKEVILLIVSIALLMLVSCSKDHQPVAYDNPVDSGHISEPPVPHYLVTRVADNTITLMWQVSDTAAVRLYRIARQDSLGGEFSVIDSVAQLTYVDRGLKNGHVYRYRICAVSKTGFMGSYSAPVAAQPGNFAISINDGDKYANSTLVTLRISSPGGASLLMVANDFQLTDASWEPYVTQKNWHLTPGDGEKVVYLKIRDLDDNETSEVLQDDIILDTQANIDLMTFSPQDSVLKPGDLIHFTMETGEKRGQAKIDIGTALMGKTLYDDGTHGDQEAEDGIYQLHFTTPGGLEVIDALVTGRFTDEAGNDADEVTSVHTLTIQKPPEAVILSAPTSLGTSETSLNLSWSRNQDDDFVAYRLYRSESPGVDTAPDRKLVAEITAQVTTSYNDTELDENHTYYYKIYVYDTFGLFSGSNEVSGTTNVNEAPEAVTLLITSTHLTPTDSTTAEIELKWTRSQDDDFAHYIVYRDMQSPVGTSSTPIDLINDKVVTTSTDSRLNLSTQYFYRVYVCDESGECTGSNEANATTPPSP